MADQRKIDAVDIDRLLDFLNGLQASGYTIDPRQFLALNDLLITLIAHGDSLDEIPLKTLTAPLFCSTPAEQQDFYQRFDLWYPTFLSARPISISAFPSPKKRWGVLSAINRIAVMWITTITIAILLITWLISISVVTIARVQINSTVLFYGLIISSVGLFVWIGWRSWIFYQENQYITREIANQEPVYTKVPIKTSIHEVMPVMQIKPIVSSLRHRTQVPSSIVDTEQTIATALSRNNWMEIIYRQRQAIPEYLVFIDRKSRFDQQASFVQEVLAKLAADGVWLHRYEFNGDPRICFPLDQKDTPLRLKDLQSRHPDARLLVFSSTNEFINPLTGRLQDWIESLSYWQERAILTPDKLQKTLHEQLQSRDFAVLPMNFVGMATLIRALEENNIPLLTNSRLSLPGEFTERPLRWIGRSTPLKAEVKALINDLKDYLGKNGFYWLCATAVYPELRWELTLHLGSMLKDEFGQRLLNLDTLLHLVRLPWFRFGYMPDWIRIALIENFTTKQEIYTRTALSEMLATPFNNKGFDLNFSSNPNSSIETRYRRFLIALFRNSQPESIYEDYVFTKFIFNSKKQRISVKLPQTIRRFIQGNSTFFTNWKISNILWDSWNYLARSFVSFWYRPQKNSVNDKSNFNGEIQNYKIISNKAPLQSNEYDAARVVYSIQFREEVLKPFFKYIKSGESFYVIGAPSMGKSSLVSFLMGDSLEDDVDRDFVKKYYLGEDRSSKTWLVQVNMHRISVADNSWVFSFYELLIHSLLIASNRYNATEEIESLKMDLAALDAQVIQSKDALMAQRFFEMAINMICQSYNIQVCFLFDEFDEIYKTLSQEVFSQLRAIRDANKYRISYMLFLRNLPERLRPPKENEGFYELISRNLLGLGPYSAMDTFHIIRQLEIRYDYELTKENREWVWAYSGGHPGLIEALFTLIKEKPLATSQIQNPVWLAKQEIISEEFRKIWEGLVEDEQNGLTKISSGDYASISPITGKLLLAKGLIKPSGGRMAYFTQLFGYWLK